MKKHVKRILSIAVVLLMAANVLVLFSSAALEAEHSIEPAATLFVLIHPPVESIPQGRTIQMSAVVFGREHWMTLTRHWSSSDPNIATVDENGRVTGVSPGTARITVTVHGSNRPFANSIEITVIPSIFGTGWAPTWYNWLLFFLGFGFIWMWFV